jgi:hypothetical protein
VAPFRFVLLATVCAVIMCCAGAAQLAGGNRIAATSPSGEIEIRFKSETFPLER